MDKRGVQDGGVGCCLVCAPSLCCTEQAHDGVHLSFNCLFFFCFVFTYFSPSHCVCLLPLFPPLSTVSFCSPSLISEVQVLLHETPAVVLIEGRYGGTKTTGGRACPLSLLLSTGLTFGKLQIAKTCKGKMFDII